MPTNKDERACYHLDPKVIDHVTFMMDQDTVVRIDVNGRGVATAEGIQVGDDEASIVKVYGGQAKVEPHKYSHTGHYVTVQGPGRMAFASKRKKGRSRFSTPARGRQFGT